MITQTTKFSRHAVRRAAMVMGALACLTLRMAPLHASVQLDTAATDAEVQALVAEWQNPPAELVNLRLGSARVHDGRVFDAVLAAALDASNSDDVRLAALSVLVIHFDPSLTVEPPQLLAAPVGEALPMITDIGPFVPGSVPLPTDRSAQAMGAFEALAAGGAPPAVTAAARYLRQAIAYVAVETITLQPGDFGLQLSCGSNFWVTNASGLALPVEFEYTASGRRHATLIDSMPRELRGAPENGGSVRLLIAEQEMASLPLGQFPCLDSFHSKIGLPLGGVGTPGGLPPPSSGSQDPEFFLVTPSSQLLKGFIETPNACYDVDGTFDATAGWQLTVEATSNQQPGQLCTESITNHEYRARFVGMPPGQHSMTVVHARDGVVLETFSVGVAVP